VKKLLFDSSIPAAAFHQATNAVIRPKIPAALVQPTWGDPSALSWKCATARRRKVMSRKKKSEKKARVDLKVQIRQMKVKMNHPMRKKATAWLVSTVEE
jgi:hypothetical protein